MPTVRTSKHLLLESTIKSVEFGTYDVICQFCTVNGMVVESEVLKAQSCALSKFSLPMHSNGNIIISKVSRQHPSEVTDVTGQQKVVCQQILIIAGTRLFHETIHRKPWGIHLTLFSMST